MYTCDKQHRITLRLNEKQFNFVRANAEILGVSPSEFLRMVINSALAASSASQDAAKRQRLLRELSGEERCGRENDETDSDDIV